jgi:cephalosporin hydroxylase
MARISRCAASVTSLPSLYSIFERYPDTDKDGAHGLHSYSGVYEELLSPLRLSVTTVLEIGVRYGGSLKAWADYFPNAIIHGIDDGSEDGIWTPDRERIHVHYGDSTRPETLHAVGSRFGPFDFLCDDGCHDPYVQIATFAALRPFLAPGGVYVIEDIADISDAERMQRLFGGAVYDLRDKKGQHDDIVLSMKF